MAVPRRRDGLIGEEYENGENVLIEEEGTIEPDCNPSPHLRDLAAAALSGDVYAFREALDNLNGNTEVIVEDGDTPLHLACLHGFLRGVELLLERGASLEARDEDGAIPLHDACAGGFTEIVELLIDRANDFELVQRMLNAADDDGDTPLHNAARGGHVEVIKLLLSSGSDPTKTNSSGKTPSELVDTEPGRVWNMLLDLHPANSGVHFNS